MIYEKDCIFSKEKLNKKDFEFIYSVTSLFKEGREEIKVFPKIYYIYVLYLLKKENEQNNIKHYIEFFEGMIEKEKIVHKITDEEEEIIRDNIIELERYIFDIEESLDLVECIDIQDEKEDKDFFKKALDELKEKRK